LGGGVLDIDLEVVLQVLADAGQVLDDLDPERAELGRRSDARELEQLRRVDRPAAEPDPPGPRRARAAARARVLDADRTVALEQDAGRKRERLDLEVGPPHRWMEVGAGRPTAALPRPA